MREMTIEKLPGPYKKLLVIWSVFMSFEMTFFSRFKSQVPVEKSSH